MCYPLRVGTAGVVLASILVLACGEGGGPEDTEITGTWEARVEGGFGQPPGAPRLECVVEWELEIERRQPVYFSHFPSPIPIACNNGHDGDWNYGGEQFIIRQEGTEVVFLRAAHGDTFMTAVVIGSRMTGRVHPLHISDATFRATR
jgi:hypothetical protein